MLHRPHGRNRWCVPNALSALTGRSSDQVTAILRRVGYRRTFGGICILGDLFARALGRLGFPRAAFQYTDIRNRAPEQMPELGRFVHTLRPGRYLVWVMWRRPRRLASHAIAVYVAPSGLVSVVDNHLREPLPVESLAGRSVWNGHGATVGVRGFWALDARPERPLHQAQQARFVF